MDITDVVKKYYGKVLQSSADLQTDACCAPDAMPAHVRGLLTRLHPEVLSRYYGCGLVIPDGLAGCTVLDLGCGAGRDVFLVSALVGAQGSVTGIDMTLEQLDVARRYAPYHAEKLGADNCRFLEGRLEYLDRLELPDAFFDVAISNCVINLVPDKGAVLRGVWRLLKPGGELYFADVYADRRVPEPLKHDPILYGECLSGALYWNDFLTLAKASGFSDPRLVADRPLSVSNPAQQAKLGNIRFFSATWRLMKLDGLESSCEDYGQAVRYRGGMVHSEHNFVLDKHHVLEAGRLIPVCGNTYRMLSESRYAPYFEFFGDCGQHFGIFPDCGQPMPFGQAGQPNGQSAPKGGCC